MSSRQYAPAMVIAIALAWVAGPAHADNLFRNNAFANVASDQKASAVGDMLTVVVYQSAEARNVAQNASRKRRSLEGSIATDVASESGELALDGDYLGQGEVRRSESFVTQISVTVTGIARNGDLIIAGDQIMNVNGEKTRIQVRGRVRPTDITQGNQILSTRIADAEINYSGQGFVSRNSRSGPIGWVFGLLGLGG